MKNHGKLLIFPLLLICLIFAACDIDELIDAAWEYLPEGTESYAEASSLNDIPEFSGDAFVVINDNIPYFTEEELTDISFESYSRLDTLGRCGAAFASVGRDLMPTEARGNIGSVKPSGWQSVSYDFVDGKSLYNRCHLIGFQLTAENANERNLITGTRYMNTVGMLPFENMVADYVKETGNHVLYRVTPVFKGSELVARGVQMEGMSVEDNGESILFNVYCYNVQPGITIDYATGYSYEDTAAYADDDENQSYVLNTGSKKFHYPDCSGVADISSANRQDYKGSRQKLIDQGYKPCGRCNP